MNFSIFMRAIPLFLVISLCFSTKSAAQINENKIGGWYVYSWDTPLENRSFGLQGDVQYRNWNLIGDMDQLLLRAAATYDPANISIRFGLGYAYIINSAYESGDVIGREHRVFQDALFPNKLGERVYLNHRLRFEQRWIEDQDLRTRYRYNLAINIPLNQKTLKKNAFYLALFNEIFINGERSTGTGMVEIFDRNRFYSGLGYSITDYMKVQAGFMEQTTSTLSKGQIHINLIHSF